MISDSKKLTDGIVIYSALFSEFEPLDFKNDALAGIRANYFNSGRVPQKDKMEINGGDSVYFGLSYQLASGKPISWKMNRNGRPYQTVKKMKGGAYCVSTYSELGAVIKRQFFNENHEWVKTEFYDGTKKAALKATATPKMVEEIFAIEYETIGLGDSFQSRLLFPSTVPTDPCSALVYSNLGMIWFDYKFKPEDLQLQEEAVPTVQKKGFGLSTTSFLYLSGKPAEIDLKNAPYFSEEENSAAAEEKSANTEEKPYSAYDKIESIILEAQKINKNVLGEEKPSVPTTEKATATEKPDSSEATKNNSNIEINKPELAVEPENNSENEIKEPEPVAEPENNSENEIKEPEPVAKPENNSENEIKEPEPVAEPENNSENEIKEAELVAEPENNSENELKEPEPVAEPENNSENEIKEPEPVAEPENNSENEIKEPEPVAEPENNSENEIKEPEPVAEPENNSENEIKEPEPVAEPENNSENEIKEPETAAEPENNSDEEKSEPADHSNQADKTDDPSAEPIIVPAEEPARDLALETSSGIYSYYGELDENNLRSGRGRTATPDGLTSYDGEYVAGKRHGFGVCYYKEGKINYSGNWNEGVRQGSGVGYRLSDGTMHAGGWKDNAPEGYGARFDKNGNLIDVSMYKNGVRDGKSVFFDEKGNVLISVWKKGELVSQKLITDEGE
ncbi:MAG: hypothetical protein U0L58_03400 [Ruminococcus sp.]|nr:hypothetical protein [Ruminococcus sp.]